MKELTKHVDDVYQTWWGDGVHGALIYLQRLYGNAFSYAIFEGKRVATLAEALSIFPRYSDAQRVTVYRFRVYYYTEEEWDSWLF